MPLMYALRAEDSDESPAVGSPPGCLSALDAYPDLVCESHRTLFIKPCANGRSSMASVMLAPPLMKGSSAMMSPCLLSSVSASSLLTSKYHSRLPHHNPEL